MRALILLTAAASLAACDRQAPVSGNETSRPVNDSAPAAAPANSAGPSFDCSKAKGQAQQLVCNDAELAAADRELDRLYVLAVADPAVVDRDVLTAMQRGWIKGRDDCWKADELRRCVLSSYAERIHEIRSASPAARAATPGALSVGPVEFACKGEEKPVTVTFLNTDPGVAYIVFGSTTATLDRVVSGSGAKYEGRTADGEPMGFWNKGTGALLGRPGHDDLDCSTSA